jgi:hypothetical protein
MDVGIGFWLGVALMVAFIVWLGWHIGHDNNHDD